MRPDFAAGPVVLPRRFTLTVACLVAAALTGGCSSTRTAEAPPARQWVGAPPAPIPGQLARPGQQSEAYQPEPGDPIKEAPVEPATRRSGPDDPSEPFSPNYGRSPAKHPIAPGRAHVADAAG
jgi:hypothetical protein